MRYTSLRNMPGAAPTPKKTSDAQPTVDTGAARQPRPIGWAKGQVTVPPEFFEPLPAEVQRLFEGH